MQSQVGVLRLNRNNEKDLKFTFGDHAGISKYKNVFAEGSV